MVSTVKPRFVQLSFCFVLIVCLFLFIFFLKVDRWTNIICYPIVIQLYCLKGHVIVCDGKKKDREREENNNNNNNKAHK